MIRNQIILLVFKLSIYLNVKKWIMHLDFKSVNTIIIIIILLNLPKIWKHILVSKNNIKKMQNML